MKKILTLFTILLTSSCVVSPYAATVNDYMVAYENVELGMSVQEIKDILKPSQYRLTNSDIKQPDKYEKEGVLVEIYYYRSGWQSDGLVTDDEFTPYLFNDGRLVSIGWQVLGGAKSQGQVVPQINNINKTSVFVY